MFFFTRSNMIKFSLGPKLKPKPVRIGNGDYCFRAVCFLESGGATPRGIITGYDRSIHVMREVEDACRLHAAVVPGSTCGPPELTLLPGTSRMCSGQLYFVFE